MLFIPCVAFGQKYQPVVVTASMDTTIWIRSNNISLVEIDMTDLSANTDSLWVGYSNDRIGFEAADGFPIVCDRDTYEQYVNGSWVNRFGVITTGGWPGLYLVVRYKVVDSSADDSFTIITNR